ncbi:MAG: hypothetical protein B7Z23_09160 [Pseudomonadales bacterium 32-61-5]|nr:MAG: hypothetical protein B7Z23_09160 [Pseudomonadales bacterium 32-61-5]
MPNLEIETGEIEGAGHASATGRFDDEQLFACAQQIIEVQIVLPKPARVHLGYQFKCFTDYAPLGVRKHLLAGNGAPGIPEAFSFVEPVEQQPSTFAVLPTLSHQRRRRQPLGSQQAGTVALTLIMPARLGANQQLGQHRAPAPYGSTDITLPRQHAQPTLNGDTHPLGQCHYRVYSGMTPVAR